MSDNDLNETFPGLESVNGFYTPFYMQEFFPKAVRSVIAEQWKDLPAERKPAYRVRAQRQAYAAIVNNEADLLEEESIGAFVDGLLDALGYAHDNGTVIDAKLLDQQTSTEIPVHMQVNDSQGRPRVQILVSLANDPDSGILESPVEQSSYSCEECARMLLADFDEPARWIVAIGLHQAVLIDRRKWGDKQCMLFDFDTIFSRNETHVYEAVAVLLHRSSLCPDDGDSVLDSFDDESSRQAVEVSDSLRSALRECVEMLGNEVIHDWTVNKHRAINELEADDLTVQCLRYMYRLLFLLFIEAKPDLGYAPMKSEVYRTAYSLESLRDIAEQMRGRMDEAEDTTSTYLADTLRQLDLLVFDGYPADNKELRQLQHREAINAVFAVPPLKAHIFDPERTELIENARLRDKVMLQIIDRMSVTRAGQSGSGRDGKNSRRQRISYATLGISQMGAVYEALLSYRGFIAKEQLYEVKRAKDDFDPLNVGYFVGESQLHEYSEDERVRYDRDDDSRGVRKGEPRTYKPGTFIYRLAGRERETSASYYTPDSLAECLVRYALKEIEPRIHQATDILKLKICEPAMGSATFLNETINQLAAKYLDMREKELVAAEGPTAAIAAEDRQKELQRVKMFIADRNIYGIDLNPIAVELGEVSLWLNTICEGSFVPWFGTQLQCGNSLIGARRVGYTEADLKSKTKNQHWYEVEAKRIGFDQSSSSTKRVYRFFTGDPGMCSYDDKTVKSIEAERLAAIKTWKKAFTAPYTGDQVKEMRRLSKVADELWRGQIRVRRDLEQETRDALAIYGFDDSGTANVADTINKGQGTFDDLSRSVNLSIREKDELLRRKYRSEETINANEYARLKLAMDYWCALWFWPIDQVDQLPSRGDFLRDMSLILTGEMPDNGFVLDGMDSMMTLDEAAQADDAHDYMRDHAVNLDELRAGDGATAKRIRLVDNIAREQHFFHWELEFADVFKDGGFDFMVGNPPWVNVHWSETDAISDVNPFFAIHKPTAADLNHRLPELLKNDEVRKVFLHEYASLAGALAFYGAKGNYPLLQGQRTNLFRCFLPSAFDFTRQHDGVSAFVHPDEVYGDTRAGILREQMMRRLRYHFQFVNEKKLFVGVDHHTAFSLNVYQNPESSDTPVKFDSIWNLYAPKTIDECYASDGSGEIPTIKDETTGTWNIRGHRDRIIEVDADVLKMFSTLVGDGTETSWKITPMVGVYARELVSALERMASVPQTLRDYDEYVTYSPMWNETNARKDGTIKDDVHFPSDGEPVIYSSPFVGVGNPLLQSTRRNYKVNSDYDFVDLTTIGEEYEPRVKYAQACSDRDYEERVQKMANGSRFDAVYRLACRGMVPLSGERTLQLAGVHPGVAWVNAIAGYGVHPERYALLALMSGLQAALPYDFFVRSIGKMNINATTLSMTPIPDSCLSSEITLHGLLLNCLTKPFAELWESCWDDEYPVMSWAKDDPRLTPETFSVLTCKWNWHTPLRTDYERRQALVELDVLASMALGLTLDELIDIYRLTFTVLKGYEDDTWYDANGRIVFSKKNYGDLIYKRPDFERIKDAQPGQTFTRTIVDDTQPGGPREREIAYVAPFDKCDRIADYRTAWAFFERKYASQLAAERSDRAMRSTQSD